MPANEQVLARGWIEKAENDLKTAILTLRAGEECPADTVGFHAQQCRKKYLKALLTARGIDFPKTHDLGELVARIIPGISVGLSAEDERRLTAYATVTRYPGAYEPVSLGEARQAVALARRIRGAGRRQLPKEALRRRSR
ncbi:MAG: HEPN domain-containing protein [Gammaproteobacteria bacterium]